MKFVYISAAALAVPAMAKVGAGFDTAELKYPHPRCPPCPTGQCCISSGTITACEPLAKLGQRCATGDAPYPGFCPCEGDMKCTGGICVQN